MIIPIADYAPSRRFHTTAFELWLMETDDNERLKLVQEVKLAHQSDNRSYPPTSQYQDLVTDPRFLAGVYLARGVTYPSTDRSRNSQPRIWINTKNRSLLEAIRSIYGGSLYDNDLGGHSLDIDSWQHSQRLLDTIYPHLPYRPSSLEGFFKEAGSSIANNQTHSTHYQSTSPHDLIY